MKQTGYIFLILILSSFFMFCNKQKKDLENELLEEYLAQLDVEPFQIEDGVYIIKSGFGSPETLYTGTASSGDTIISMYKGYLLSDETTVIDENNITNPQRYAFLEDNVIKGWELAMAYMKKDETAKIIIHSDYAYKGDQVGLIPPFSTLIYDVRILDIVKQK